MGVRLAALAVALAAAGLVASTPTGYLQGRQAANGGFVEPAGSSGPQLTAWAALGFAFDAFMDVWEWLSFYPHTWQAFTALYLRGIWFDGAHATGNFVLALVAGPELRRLLERYARRLKAVVVWA